MSELLHNRYSENAADLNQLVKAEADNQDSNLEVEEADSKPLGTPLALLHLPFLSKNWATRSSTSTSTSGSSRTWSSKGKSSTTTSWWTKRSRTSWSKSRSTSGSCATCSPSSTSTGRTASTRWFKSWSSRPSTSNPASPSKVPYYYIHPRSKSACREGEGQGEQELRGRAQRGPYLLWEPVPVVFPADLYLLDVQDPQKHRPPEPMQPAAPVWNRPDLRHRVLVL